MRSRAHARTTAEAVKAFVFDRAAERVVTIRGRSMEPLLPDGSAVRLRRFGNKPRPGRVYVVVHNGELTAHRCIRRTGQGVLLWGDNNWRGERVPPYALIAEVDSGPHRLVSLYIVIVSRLAAPLVRIRAIRALRRRCVQGALKWINRKKPTKSR
jgi:signal peptidase I